MEKQKWRPATHGRTRERFLPQTPADLQHRQAVCRRRSHRARIVFALDERGLSLLQSCRLSSERQGTACRADHLSFCPEEHCTRKYRDELMSPNLAISCCFVPFNFNCCSTVDTIQNNEKIKQQKNLPPLNLDNVTSELAREALFKTQAISSCDFCGPPTSRAW